MIRKIRSMLVPQKSVASILGAFTKAVAELRSFGQEKAAESDRLDERADDLRNEADIAEDKALDAELESIDAYNTAARLENMLGIKPEADELF